MAKKHRDNQYYLDRLRDEHPLVYADYKAGKFKNASEAFVAAGLRKQASALKALKSAWSKATSPERDAFKATIGCTTSPAVSASTAPSGTVSANTTISVASKGKQQLPPALATQVREIMDRRSLKLGKLMVAIGRSPLDASPRGTSPTNVGDADFSHRRSTNPNRNERPFTDLHCPLSEGPKRRVSLRRRGGDRRY